MNNITTVIFDIGKVLVQFDWESYVKSYGYTQEINEEIGKLIFDSPLWKERDRGDKAEEEYKEAYILLAPHLEKEINEIFENIVNIVEEYPYASQWIRNIKAQGKKVYLLSNYSKVSFENDREKFDFIKYVDGMVISYEIQHVKPEPEIYTALFNKYNINPSEAVFLDDVKENLIGAEKLGLHTIHVTTHEKAVEKLALLGIK